MAQAYGENLKQAMDTLRERNHLEELWAGDAPWKVWEGS